MHKSFRLLLDHATGVSEFVIVVNLDIRGFSRFSKSNESPDIAMFIKRVYMRLIDKYFSNASFFKPTGDGLLLTIPYSEDDLEEKAQTTLASCLAALTDFSSFCEKDPMINFAVPDQIGIGIARGTACKLTSKKKILDYSGRILNLASRLMDLARPKGIVIDGAFNLDLLTDDQRKLFKSQDVFIRGIAEDSSIPVFSTKDLTEIPAINLRPLSDMDWEVYTEKLTLKQLLHRGSNFNYPLKYKPIDSKKIRLRLTYPCVKNGKRIKGISSFQDVEDIRYISEAGEHTVKINFAVVTQKIKTTGVKDNWKISIELKYPK
jgi:class 3 adenylate cyclase